LENFKALIPKFVSAVKERETGALTYDWYLNEERMECKVLETYADSDAVLAHAANVGELLMKSLEMSTLTLEVHGNPNEELTKALGGFSHTVYPFYLGL
jgi:quinol monooxygenase YgiN